MKQTFHNEIPYTLFSTNLHITQYYQKHHKPFSWINVSKIFPRISSQVHQESGTSIKYVLLRWRSSSYVVFHKEAMRIWNASWIIWRALCNSGIISLCCRLSIQSFDASFNSYFGLCFYCCCCCGNRFCWGYVCTL